MQGKKIHNLGTILDRKQRQTTARVDDESRRAKVAAARAVIYENNYAVGNEASEALLKDQSLVATRASCDHLIRLRFIC